MKQRLLLVMATCLVVSLGNAKATTRLEGCMTALDIAKSLAALAGRDWGQVNLSELRQVWPTELSGLNCDSDVCHSVWSKDRIIRGHCECCATFSFKVLGDAPGSRREQLDEVIVNYSAEERDKLVSDAKEFAAASGLKATDVATIGREAEQHFSWRSTSGKINELSGVELRIHRRGHLWELYFNWGRNLLEAGGVTSMR